MPYKDPSESPTKPPAYSRVRRQWTQRGKIVYERPKHTFKVKDVIRIIQSIETFDAADGEAVFFAVSRLIKILLQVMSSNMLDTLERRGLLPPFVDDILQVLAQLAYSASTQFVTWFWSRLKEFILGGE